MLPFIALYWLTPLYGKLTIDNDYPIYSIQQQMELQYSLVHGSFPLFSPGFAGGRSSAALTLGQMFHPLSHLAAHSFGYWDGHALEWNTFWRLVSLGLTQLVLFNLLRKLQLRIDFAFILSFLTVYNQRMLDMFRYGASLESYTGFLLLCAAMAYFYVAPSRFIGPLSVIAATYLLICGGHPQIAYLGLLGAALMCLVIPNAVSAIRPDIILTSRKALVYYLNIGSYACIGLLLASAYTFPLFFEFLRDTPERTGQPYAWSLDWSGNWAGELTSFFNPLRSDVHGAFGSSSLILIAALVPFALFSGRQKGREIMIALWFILITVFLCSIGADTPIHYFFWHYVPFANTFRVPGRITMLLPPIFMLILAWFFRVADDEAATSPAPRISAESFLLQAAAVFLTAWIFIPGDDPNSGMRTPSVIQHYPAWVDIFILSSGLGCLLLAAIRVSRFRFHMVAGLLLCCLVVIQASVQLRYGTWVTERTPTPTLAQMNAEKQSDLAFRGNPGYGMEPTAMVERTAKTSQFATFHRIDTTAPLSDRVASVYTSYNRVILRVNAYRSGYLTFSAPYSSQWHASVDAKESKIYPTDQNEQSVLLSAGAHDVEFRFLSPASVAGMLISCFTALLIGLYVSQYCISRWVRAAAIVAMILASIGFFIFWKHSLYNGQDLQTRYVWVSDNGHKSER